MTTDKLTKFKCQLTFDHLIPDPLSIVIERFPTRGKLDASLKTYSWFSRDVRKN